MCIKKQNWGRTFIAEIRATAPRNHHDPFAVATYRSSNVVGHVPRKISTICYVFLRKSGGFNYYYRIKFYEVSVSSQNLGPRR